MTTERLVLFTALTACAMTAAADVTVATQTEGKASFLNVGGDGVSQIKGNRQRNEQSASGKTHASIIDVDGRRFINLDDKKKSAEVTSLDSIGEALQKSGAGNFQATLTKTAEKKTIASYPCSVYNVNISLPFSPTGANSGLDMTLVMSGTACVSSAVPGLADYQAFYKAAADSGFIFGDPRTAKSPTGAAQAKAYAAMTKKMAEAGMALESHITVTAKGDSPLAGMMAKLAASDIHSTVTKITTDSLPAEAFDIPAGYKVKMQK
ncbi:MAG TPA: hypothetical protein VET48_11695 [Steroidobacteraceae bacterium]|nr:hypothetical protein [Steroidobacteraceae bacterium]